MMGRPSRSRTPVCESGPDQIDIEVGLNLRRARLARGFTQTELGDALGISFQQIQKYERGANRVSASMLVKAARFLGVSPAELLPPDDNQGLPADEARRSIAVRRVAEVANAYCAVQNPSLRGALLHLMLALDPIRAAAAKASESEMTS